MHAGRRTGGQANGGLPWRSMQQNILCMLHLRRLRSHELRRLLAWRPCSTAMPPAIATASAAVAAAVRGSCCSCCRGGRCAAAEGELLPLPPPLPKTSFS